MTSPRTPPFHAKRQTITDEDGCVYTSRLWKVSAFRQTEVATGLNRRQAQAVRDLLNRLYAQGIGRRVAS